MFVWAILWPVRELVLLALIGACGFEVDPAAPSDAPPDVPPDTPIIPTWAVDPTSGKAVPDSASDWMELSTAYGLGLSAPDHVWLMQESSGTLAASVGAATLSPLNGPTYANVVSGWTRRGVGTSETGVNQGFLNSTIGNLNGTSHLLLLYVAIGSAPSSERSICGIGAGTDHRYVAVTPAPFFKGTGNGIAAPATGTVQCGLTVHPIVLSIDPPRSAYTVYSDQEQISVAWQPTGGNGPLLVIGNATVGAASVVYLYGALWSGSKAELSSVQVKKLLQGLGWTVSGF